MYHSLSFEGRLFSQQQNGNYFLHFNTMSAAKLKVFFVTCTAVRREEKKNKKVWNIILVLTQISRMIYLSVLLHFHLSSQSFIHQYFIYTCISHFYTIFYPHCQMAVLFLHSVHQGEWGTYINSYVILAFEWSSDDHTFSSVNLPWIIGQTEANICSPWKKYWAMTKQMSNLIQKLVDQISSYSITNFKSFNSLLMWGFSNDTYSSALYLSV